MVALHLICWAENGKLRFTEHHEAGFSGDVSIASQWSAILRAWLHKGPFPKLIDMDFLIRTRQLVRVEASAQAIRSGTR